LYNIVGLSFFELRFFRGFSPRPSLNYTCKKTSYNREAGIVQDLVPEKVFHGVDAIILVDRRRDCWEKATVQGNPGDNPFDSKSVSTL